MQITFIGFALIPLALFLMLKEAKYLLYLLVFFSTFTATSVINIPSQTFGMQAALFLGALFTLKMFFITVKNREHLILSKQHAKLLAALIFFPTFLLASFIVGSLNGLISFFNFTQYIYLLSGIFIAISISLYLFFHQDRVLSVFRVFIFSSIFVSLWGLYQLFAGMFGFEYLHMIFNNSISDAAQKFDMTLQAETGGSGLKRVTSVAVEPSYLARTSAMALVMILFYYFLNSYKALETKHILALGLIIFIMMAAVSSTAVLGFAFIFLLFFIYRPIKSIPLIIASILIIAIVILSDDTFIDTFESLTTGKTDSGSYRVRMATVMAAWEGFISSPIFGLGWETNPSNDVFSKLLGNSGLMGTLIFIYIYLSVIYSGLKKSKNYNDTRRWLYVSVALTILTLLFVDAIASLSFVFSFMWVFLGMGIIVASYDLPEQATEL